MEKWVLLRKGANYEQIGERFQISPRLACLIRNRDVIGDEAIDQYLNGTLSDLNDGMLMKGMNQAIDILKEKIEEGKKIRVIGDYDIDGVNATYILLEGLETLGADVDYDIPNRMTDGYGLNEELIRRAAKDEVDTIVTCDNGIAACDEITYGKNLGMTIVVTDHHEVSYEDIEGEKHYLIPPADAVVDPKQPDCTYPFKELCGAAIAYKLIENLSEAMEKDAEDFDYLIENVAIATVGDVVELEGENRIFVKEGLQMLERTHNLGLRALIDCNGIDKRKVTSYHVGFVLGPCMNASGRLDTAKHTLELLRADTKKDADILAGDLKAMNDSRKELTEKAVEQAIGLMEQTTLKNDKVLVVYLPECHESLAGIVAGRIREIYSRPVFVLTDAKDGVKGSGRSIDAYNMYEELNRCRDLLTKYGGHKMAAGLSLRSENVDVFRERLNSNCGLTEEEMAEKIVIDMEMPFSCVTEGMVEELSKLEPFGKGNTKPVFAARNVALLSGRILGKNRNVLKLRVRDAYGTEIDAMCFRHVENFLEYLGEKYGDGAGERLLRGGRNTGEMTLSVTYYPDINEYMGRVTPQIVITHYK